MISFMKYSKGLTNFFCMEFQRISILGFEAYIQFLQHVITTIYFCAYSHKPLKVESYFYQRECPLVELGISEATPNNVQPDGLNIGPSHKMFLMPIGTSASNLAWDLAELHMCLICALISSNTDTIFPDKHPPL